MAPILILDEDPTFREIISLRLRVLGYTTAGAGRAHTGLELARRFRPPLILLDARMPGVDGANLLRSIRQEPGLRSTPVVMLTDSLETLDRDAALEAQGWLRKPGYGFTELADAVLRLAGPPPAGDAPAGGRAGAA